MSLRWRVVLLVMLLNCAAVGAGLALGVARARAAVRAETASALDAAELVLRGAGGDRAAWLAASGLRHVRLAGDGPPTTPVRPRAPGWFEALVGAEDAARTIMAGGRPLTIAADPRDEVTEAWGELTGWLAVAGVTLGLTMLAAWAAVTRALAPLRGFGRALDAMAEERPGGPLPAAGTPELEAVSARIAALDRRLAAERHRNAELSRALVELQDAERAGIAREVHDELGPLLFAIGVDAHALLRAADTRAVDRATLRDRARSIGDLVGDVRALSRRILGRLRPMALDHLPLSAVLADLFADVRRRHPDVALDTEVAGDVDALGAPAALALFRVAQEAVLNALRHGRPSRVAVRVAVDAAAARVLVEDDGRGIAGAAPGHGLVGMRERVTALGGSMRVEPRDGNGTRVDVVLPGTAARASANALGRVAEAA